MASTLPHDPLLGSLLDGRYRVVSLLGRGGMGNVYVADETRLRRRCAVKVLHPHLAHERVNVERFLREAQTIAQFKHPNIVEIFASGEEPSGIVFFAMELLEGEDLTARLKDHAERPFTVQDCCVWAIEAARAVGVVHAAGLIHRDLKTSNIFLARRYDGEQVVKLLDFGIARREEGSELTGTGMALGTPGYMAPEQFHEVEIDRRVDIYSFGVLLFRMLTGRLPFMGDAFTLALKHRDASPPRPSRVAPEAGISAQLEAVVLKCMAKHPAGRYPSMQAVERALVEVLQEEGLERTRDVRLAPTRPPSTRSLHAAPLLVDAGAAPRELATPPSLAKQTGPTAMGASSPRVGRRVYLATAAGGFSVLLLLASVLMRREPSTSPAQVEASTNAAEAPAAPLPVQPEVVPNTAKDLAAQLPTHTEVRPNTDEDLAAQLPEVVRDVAAGLAARRPAQSLETAASAPVVTPPRPSPPAVLTKKAASSPAAAAERRPASRPVPAPKKSEPVDPLKQVRTHASACRRKFKAVDGPPIIVTYWVGVDGKPQGASPSQAGELGACLATAVSRVQFEPKLELSKQLAL